MRPVTVRYVCGDTFLLNNPLVVDPPMTFAVQGTSWSIALTVPAGREPSVYARAKGSLDRVGSSTGEHHTERRDGLSVALEPSPSLIQFCRASLRATR
jgi:hypothetical protein